MDKKKFNLKDWTKQAKNVYENINTLLERNKKEQIGDPEELDGVFHKNVNTSLDKTPERSVSLQGQLAGIEGASPGSVSEKQLKNYHEKGKDITVPAVNLETARYTKKEEDNYSKIRGKNKGKGGSNFRYKNEKDNRKNIEENNPTATTLSQTSYEEIKNKAYPKITWTGEDLEKIKTADAMIFHIYAKAEKDDRSLSEQESYFISQIEKEKKDILTGKA